MSSINEIQAKIVEEFNQLEAGNKKYEYLIDIGVDMSEMDATLKTDEKLVKGCHSNVWFDILCKDNKLLLVADSDSLIVKGLAALLVRVFSGQPATDILNADAGFIEQIGLWRHLSSQRGNGLTAMLEHIHQAALECMQPTNHH